MRSVGESVKGYTCELIGCLGLVLPFVMVAAIIVSATLDRARVREAQMQVGFYATGVEAYFEETGELPESLDDLVDRANGAPNLARHRESDPWGRSYTYSASGRDYLICSRGDDRRCGTHADICVSGPDWESRVELECQDELADLQFESGGLEFWAYRRWRSVAEASASLRFVFEGA